MMIMRFHRLIQSRLLWMIFLGVVVISFVFMGAISDSDMNNPTVARLREPVGHIRGKAVTFQRFDSTSRIIANQMQQRVPTETLNQLVWDRLTLLDLAEQCGIEVPIRTARSQFMLEFLNEEGKVDAQRLQRFRARLGADPLSEEDYVRYTQDELILATLQRAWGSYTLVPPFDAERWSMLQTERYEIEFAPVKDALVTEPLDINEEKLLGFHRENAEQFGISEKRRVRYLTLPIRGFADTIKPATEAEARREYAANPDRYTRTLPAGEEEGAEPKREAIPFEDVQVRLMESITKQRVSKAAEEMAMSYSVHLTPRRGRPASTLEQIAAEAGLQIQTTPAFSQRDSIEGVDNSWAFVRAAFELDDSPIGRNSRPVVGVEEVRILQLEEIIAPRPSQLEEVRNDVALAATNHFRRVAVATLATNLVGELKADLLTGVTFKTAAEQRGLSVTQAPAYQIKDLDPSTSILPPGVPQAAMACGAGEIFGPVDSMYGSVYLGHVISRVPVPEDAATLSIGIRSKIAEGIQMRGFEDRLRALVLRADLKVANETATEEPPAAATGG